MPMMSTLKRCLLVGVVSCLMISSVVGDLYLQIPRGSNNRLNEQSANRQNGDRLFDSQNNNRGGYNVGDRGRDPADTSAPGKAYKDPAFTYDLANDPIDTDIQYQMVYYEGSELSVEWTNQHGCGGNEATDPHKLNCDIILQYMCQTTDGVQDGATGKLKKPADGVIPGAESLRDGITTDRPDTIDNIDDTQTISDNLNKGHHESEQHYFECDTRQRNKGLFTADQWPGDSATHTRQNPNGNRRGLECAEERDYYPYWVPSPWKDVIIMTDHVSDKCNNMGQYVGQSQNNNWVYKCVPDDKATAANRIAAIKATTQAKCDAAGNGAVWTQFKHNLPAPECRQVEWSRVNHLGNGRFGQPLMYNWTLPTIATLKASNVYMYSDASGASYAKCVARLRYNMTTDDYDPNNTTAEWNNNPQNGVISPVTNNPTVDIGSGFEGVKLNVNTAQFGRTFQDRSHVFYVRSRPSSIPATAKIYNLGVRGKRGNIVQTFPAVEYDFQPSRLSVTSNDYIHVQWTGSNTHNNGNPAGDGQAGDAGEGRTGTDRHNMAQLASFSQNYPIPLDKFVDNMWSRSTCMKLDGTPVSASPSSPLGDISLNAAALDCAVYLTTSGHFRSAAAVNAVASSPISSDKIQFDSLLNNSPASLIGGVVMKFDASAIPTGKTSVTYDYMCTRNNNFSNRGQKGSIEIHA